MSDAVDAGAAAPVALHAAGPLGRLPRWRSKPCLRNHDMVYYYCLSIQSHERLAFYTPQSSSSASHPAIRERPPACRRRCLVPKYRHREHAECTFHYILVPFDMVRKERL
jgi:hypothetical protein